MWPIPRAEWGARYDNGAGPAPLPASEVWLHHSVTAQLPPEATVEQECAAMRALEQIGETRFGTGISYTIVGFPSGRLYEGHGVDRRGTHTGGRNDVSRAICWHGNYMIHKPTAALIRSTAWVLREGARLGWWRVAAFRGGHRDVRRLTGDSVATACPGDHAYAVIGEVNQQAGAPLVAPIPTPIPVTEEDDMIDVFYSTELGRTALNIGGGRVQEMTGPVDPPNKPGSTRRGKVQAQLDSGKLVGVDLDAADFAALVDGDPA